MQFTSAFQNPPRKRRQGGKLKPVAVNVNSPFASTRIPPSALDSVNRRLDDLEQVVYHQHDPQLRAPDFWATFGWLLDQGDPLVPLLGGKLQDWNSSRPPEGPHLWGPLRRCLTQQLCVFLDSKVQSDGLFAQFHMNLSSPSEFGADSVSRSSAVTIVDQPMKP
eukprot:TRINITY_DN9156_c1_g1_i1.p2 TRINITY_DN9156_c1_g1~~TRINITY_DN9156_c1_g1_i1.p2  ORF type:complete len:164 (-),score=10.00 TRINITY_DN9156_c1_g1_i1:502-993(-)